MEKENREIEVGYGSNDKGEMVFGLSVGDYTLSNLSPVETKQIYEIYDIQSTYFDITSCRIWCPFIFCVFNKIITC